MPEEKEEDTFDVKQEIQTLRRKVKRLESRPETWICDASYTGEDESAGWFLTVVEKSSDTVLSMDLGEDPRNPDTVLLALFEAMLNPEEGDAYRPAVIEFTDAKFSGALKKKLERLEIDSQVAEERPEVLDFIERSLQKEEQPSEENFEEIRELPTSDVFWEIDWRPLDQWLPDEETGQPTQPWMALVAHQENLILAQLLTMTPPDAQAIRQVISQAAFRSPLDEQVRPRAIHVPSADHLVDVKPLAEGNRRRLPGDPLRNCGVHLCGFGGPHVGSAWADRRP